MGSCHASQWRGNLRGRSLTLAEPVLVPSCPRHALCPMQVIYGRGDSPDTLMTPATSITLDGLDPASRYNVTVRARTSAGPNEPIMENFWTRIESELTDLHTIGAVGCPLPLFPLPSFPSSPPLPPHPLSLSPSPPLPVSLLPLSLSPPLPSFLLPLLSPSPPPAVKPFPIPDASMQTTSTSVSVRLPSRRQGDDLTVM